MRPQNDTTPAGTEQAVPLDLDDIRARHKQAPTYRALGHVADEVLPHLLDEVERLRVVEVASIGAHALLEDAEAAIERVRALHVPWYEASGKRYENRVYVPQCDMEHVTDHVCTLGDAYHAEACIPGEEHQVLACCECRQATEDGDPGYPLWPCPTLRALDLVAGDDGPEVSRG